MLTERMTEMCSDRQLRAVNRITRARGGLVWWKVGEGKTRIAIFTFASLQEVYNWALPSICLIVCRRRTFRDWTDEIKRCISTAQVYTDSCPAYPPSGTAVFLLISEGMLVKEVASLQEDHRIRFVVLDECWLYANHKSKRAIAARKLTLPRKAMGLSGTVMKAQDLAEVYAQLMVVHKQRYLAKNITEFRSKYQTFVKDPQLGHVEYHPKKGSYHGILTKLSDVVDVNFPSNRERRIHEQFHNVEATKQQLKMFRDLKETFDIEEYDLLFNNALATSIKAQQISNGWLEVEKGKFVSIPTHKPGKLQDELEDIVAAGSTAVVWCAFRHDLEMLADFLPFATMQMRGGEEFDLDRWNSGDVRVCLATEASGEGVNHFAQTPYAIYFSGNYKWKDMQQSRGRTDRKSTRHSECFYKYLQVDGSPDEHIYRTALASGAEEARLLLHSGLKDWMKS